MMQVLNNRLDVTVQSVLTDNGKEFTTHHTTYDERSPLRTAAEYTENQAPAYKRTNGACERLNRTILEEFYQVTFRKTIYKTVLKLNEYRNNL